MNLILWILPWHPHPVPKGCSTVDLNKVMHAGWLERKCSTVDQERWHKFPLRHVQGKVIKGVTQNKGKNLSEVTFKNSQAHGELDCTSGNALIHQFGGDYDVGGCD